MPMRCVCVCLQAKDAHGIAVAASVVSTESVCVFTLLNFTSQVAILAAQSELQESIAAVTSQQCVPVHF